MSLPSSDATRRRLAGSPINPGESAAVGALAAGSAQPCIVEPKNSLRPFATQGCGSCASGSSSARDSRRISDSKSAASPRSISWNGAHSRRSPGNSRQASHSTRASSSKPISAIVIGFRPCGSKRCVE